MSLPKTLTRWFGQSEFFWSQMLTLAALLLLFALGGALLITAGVFWIDWIMEAVQ